jgi:hypothetical protein
VLECAPLDLSLGKTGLDRRHHATLTVDLGDQRSRPRSISEVSASTAYEPPSGSTTSPAPDSWPGSAGCAGPAGPRPRSATPAPRRSRWCAATGRPQHGGQRLDGGADDVVQRLVRRQGRARGLGVKAQHRRAGIARAQRSRTRRAHSRRAAGTWPPLPGSVHAR